MRNFKSSLGSVRGLQWYESQITALLLVNNFRETIHNDHYHRSYN